MANCTSTCTISPSVVNKNNIKITILVHIFVSFEFLSKAKHDSQYHCDMCIVFIAAIHKQSIHACLHLLYTFQCSELSIVMHFKKNLEAFATHVT